MKFIIIKNINNFEKKNNIFKKKYSYINNYLIQKKYIINFIKKNIFYIKKTTIKHLYNFKIIIPIYNNINYINIHYIKKIYTFFNIKKIKIKKFFNNKFIFYITNNNINNNILIIKII